MSRASALRGRLTGARVLVIEDGEADRRLLERFLTSAGCADVALAATGEEGLARLRSAPPDLVLLDMMMPGMHGDDVLRQLRAIDGDVGEVPVVVLTADVTDETRYEALELGATDVLSKPLDLLEVGLRVANLIESHRLHRLVRTDNEALRDELAAQWGARLRDRTELLGRVVTAQEEERARIARELHDGTIQTLFAIALQLESASEQSPPDTGVLADLAAATRRASDEMRRLIFDLRSPILDEAGLREALRELIDDHADIGATLAVEGLGELPGPVATEIYRIVQALLGNVRRHAAPCRAEVAIREVDEHLDVVVRDDGPGFTVRPSVELVEAGHLGLAVCEERAERLGGGCTVTSAPGEGTEVRVRVPVPAAGVVPAPASGSRPPGEGMRG